MTIKIIVSTFFAIFAFVTSGEAWAASLMFLVSITMMMVADIHEAIVKEE